MSVNGGLKAYKKVAVECEHPNGELKANSGEAVQWKLVFCNDSPEIQVVDIIDDEPVGLESWSWTSSTQDGYGAQPVTGNTVNGTEGIEDTVTIPPGGTVCYTIDGLIAQTDCSKTITNVAAYSVEGEPKIHYVHAPTVHVCGDIETDFRISLRDQNCQTDAIMQFFVGDDISKVQIFLDWIECGGRDIVDLITAVNELLELAGIDWPANTRAELLAGASPAARVAEEEVAKEAKVEG